MRKFAVGVLLICLGSAAYGLHETLNYHYYLFAKMFPHADQLYWDPFYSWRNKYEGGDPVNGPRFFGSTTFLVALTDAKHLCSFFFMWGWVFGGFLAGYWYASRKNKYHFFLIFSVFLALIFFVIFPFHFVYSLFF